VLDVRASQLIRVFGPDQQDAPLESQQLAGEELLLTIPPANSTP
jgi:hypothetical protein